MYYYGARYYDPVTSIWQSVDPLAEQTMQPYSAFNNNPVVFIDPTGMSANPVFGSDGTYKGNTKEGYTGEVIISDCDMDFSEMSADEFLTTEADIYDNVRNTLTGDAKSKIWTHIASQLEGEQIYDETFTLSSIKDRKIKYDSNASGSWESAPKIMYSKWENEITGSDRYSYATTVENLQSSIVVHEWYSHIKKGNGENKYPIVNGQVQTVHLKSHRLAYKNVINFKALWNKTTDDYKGFNMRTLLRYTKLETGRTQVDPLYRNLFKKYKDK